MFRELSVVDMGLGPRVRVEASSGLPQYARIAVDGLPQGNPIYLKTGESTEIYGTWQHDGTTGHSVSVCPQGDWGSTDVDLSAQLDSFASGRARRLSITIEPTVLAEDQNQLSGWDLTGLRRFINCRPVDARPNWASLRWVLADSGGTRTVQLYNGGTSSASGNVAGDGTCTLAQVTSGVTGTVEVTYTGDASGTVYFVWPASYAIHYTTGSGFTGADFPRTAEATLYDDGHSNAHRWSSDILGAATWYVVVHQVDEAGNESTGLASGGYTGITYGPPLNITALSYVTGDASNTQVTFTGGSGATGYRVYDSLDSGVQDFDNPTTTTGDSGALTLTGIDTGWSGYRYVTIRSLVGSVDDGNGEQLRIEYSGGLVVLPRPPAPGFGLNVRTSGRTMQVPCTVSLAEYESVPVYVELHIWEASSGSFDSGSVFATGTIATGTMLVGSEIVITVSGTNSGDGEFYYLARTRDANGITSSNSTFSASPLRLTTAKPGQPDSLTVKSS